MITPKQICLIHTLKNKVKMTEEEYRDVLSKYGVKSSKELDTTAASMLISEMLWTSQDKKRAGLIQVMRELLQRLDIKHHLAYVSKLVRYEVTNLNQLLDKELLRVIAILRQQLKRNAESQRRT